MIYMVLSIENGHNKEGNNRDSCTHILKNMKKKLKLLLKKTFFDILLGPAQPQLDLPSSNPTKPTYDGCIYLRQISKNIDKKVSQKVRRFFLMFD